ncbi:MAG: hypothetical protein KF774_17465 [Planctomyces sp.]|nr:hypothetical protein [Planctomyces sp.]
MFAARMFGLAAVLAIASSAQDSAGTDLLSPDLRQALAVVEDRSELHPEEDAAYYGLLQAARDADAAALSAAARAGRSSREAAWKAGRRSAYSQFADFLNAPEAIRGRPVAVSGGLKRAVASAADENPYGIDELYEIWLVSPDSQSHPTVVVATSLPPGFPMGESDEFEVHATGLFLKLWSYPARDKHTRLAPLVMAGTVSLVDRRFESPLRGWTNAALIAVGAAVIGLLWFTRRRRVSVADIPSDAPPDFRAIAEALAEPDDNPEGPPSRPA